MKDDKTVTIYRTCLYGNCGGYVSYDDHARIISDWTGVRLCGCDSVHVMITDDDKERVINKLESEGYTVIQKGHSQNPKTH
jgi:Zn-finger protein